MVELLAVDPSKAREIWPHVGPMLRSAFTRTGFALFSDLERDVFNGSALVWLVWNGESIEAAVATALHPTDSGLVCAILACAGSGMERWLQLIGTIEQYAKDEGCVRCRLVGRKGWIKALPDYREKFAVMEKELAA